MAKCEYCGRELMDGEVCGCSQLGNIQQIDWNDYFQLTLSKDMLENMKKNLGILWENLKKTLETLRENLSERDYDQGIGGPYENNMQITGECVVPTEQEIPVRQYNVARLRTPLWKKAYGRLQVTNKRVLFRAKGKSLAGPIEIENEFSLEEIGGIEIKQDYRFNLLIFLMSTLTIWLCTSVYFVLIRRFIFSKSPLVISTLLTTIAAVAALVLIPKKTWKSALAFCSGISWYSLSITTWTGFWAFIATVFIIIGIVTWILSALVDDLHIVLKIKGAHGAIEIGRKLQKDERSGFSVVQPWKDTQIAIRELGALIDDIKRFGNEGIKKWKI